MKKPTKGRRRSRIIKFLLLPLFAIIFVVGWSLYWVGQRETKQPKKPVNRTTTKLNEELELIVIPKEEQTIET